MAAERGGNCELTEPGQAVVKHGVTIVGYSDLNSRLAKQSSTLYGSNLFRLAEELCKSKDGIINVNMEDDAIRGLTVIKDGVVTWPAPAPKLPPAAKPAEAKPITAPAKGHGAGGAPASPTKIAVIFGVAALAFLFIGAYAPAAFLAHLTVFVLACFVGYMVVWNVTPALHTPPLVGGEARPDDLIRWLAVAGIALTTVNMFGGFAVTRRMLSMFRK
jgi:NAD(P) transhydrogenase subunit alpha